MRMSYKAKELILTSQDTEEYITPEDVNTVWYHILAVGLLQASFEMCRLYLSLTIRRPGVNLY
jgi:hypothetical protein